MQILIGQVDKIIYQNDGFFIGVLKSREKFSAHYFASEIDHLQDAAVTLKGEWEEHRSYGRTFKAESLTVNQNELFFFLNRVVKGFTKKLTAELIEKYTQEGLVDILENRIDTLLEIKGMSQKRLERLASGWKQFRSLRELGEFLAPYGVSPNLLQKIASNFKELSDPIGAISKNPYILRRIHGIGFKKADEIAHNMGISPDDPRRIEAALDHTLALCCDQEGNSCIDPLELGQKIESLLELGNNEAYQAALLNLIAEGSVISLSSGRLSPLRVYEAELFLLESFAKRRKMADPKIHKDLRLFLEEHQLNLGEEQYAALEKINEGCKLLFLIGYAGTGKSTTAKALLDLLSLRHGKEWIMTCALSGIASQRIHERSGYPSGTIQSLLVKYESHDTFPFKVLLIDEASMINSTLMARLLSKVSNDATLIIVGDDAQLPPIGAGSPLSDVIALDLAETVMLRHIYRQNPDQAITLIANEIRQGQVPNYRNKFQDFEFIEIDLPNRYQLKQTLSGKEFDEITKNHHEHILAKVAEISLGFLEHSRSLLQNKEIKAYLNYFQVLSPMRGNTLGVERLNTVLQDYFNPNAKKSLKHKKGEFRLFDKVVHIKNENMLTYTPDEFKENSDPVERRVFNGMCGLIFKIDEEEEILMVYYPNEENIVQYKFEDAGSLLELSYALSVHKVQGMEYENVVIVMSSSHHIMLNTKLLYTAITRAKKQCSIVGESYTFESACRRLESTRRLTTLQELKRV